MERVVARRPRTRRGGFSLFDALAATTVLGIALFAFASHSVSLTRSGKTADMVGTATALAQQKLEQLRSLPPDAPDLDTGTYLDPDNPLQADGGPGGEFARSWAVSATNVPGNGLKTVSVTVRWTDSRPHETRMAAYVRCATTPCS